MDKVKVLMLVGQGDSSVLMFNGIKDAFAVEKVIVENSDTKKNLILKRMKKLGLMRVIGQVLFMLFNKLLKKCAQARIIEIKKNSNLIDIGFDKNIVSNVHNVNSAETIKLLQKYQPDLVVINGTRIIKKEVLKAIKAPFINTHVGITPKYRGVHGGYWALTENDPAHCGVTIHLVDTGIDTGGILYQGTIKIIDKDNFNTYPYLQMAIAIPLMKQAIKDVANKTHKIINPEGPSQLWSHPTIFEYLKFRWFYGVK